MFSVFNKLFTLNVSWLRKSEHFFFSFAQPFHQVSSSHAHFVEIGGLPNS
jgi:hypothetical protein